MEQTQTERVKSTETSRDKAVEENAKEPQLECYDCRRRTLRMFLEGMREREREMATKGKQTYLLAYECCLRRRTRIIGITND